MAANEIIGGMHMRELAIAVTIALAVFVGWCALFYKAGREYGRVEGYDEAIEDIKKRLLKPQK